MGIWQDLFEYGEQLGYYQILRGSLITFTEKLTHNLVVCMIQNQISE